MGELNACFLDLVAETEGLCEQDYIVILYSEIKVKSSLHSQLALFLFFVFFRPMDLSTIKKNIENGLIRSTAEFQRDIMLMFQNAVMYNSSDHDVYHMAVEMQRDVLEQIQVH